ncbi:MAG TPA: SDR family oxidoreductase [Chlamydiales bacterium]|nr:SDR family oxidoreductase [Chlamydiales bacterium]
MPLSLAPTEVSARLAPLPWQKRVLTVWCYRSDEKGAQKTVEAIQKQGRRAKAIYADFSDSRTVNQFFHEAVQFLGSIDCLVNNAAGYDSSSLLDLKIDDFQKLLQVGVLAVTELTQYAAREMIQRGIKGTIINISAITGERPYPNRLAHASVKAALNMVTKSSALALAPFGIRVNAIAAGTTPYDPQEPNSYPIPLGRVGLAEDHAKAALFLASDDSSWITGQILTVDGGQSLSLFSIDLV